MKSYRYLPMACLVLATAVLCCISSVQAGTSSSRASYGQGLGINGDGLPLYTSPGALQQPELKDLLDAREQFDKSFRRMGPVEGSLTSPYQQPPVESNEQLMGTVNNETRRRMLNVFLPDSRVEVDSTKYPYRTVGVFGGCTATLVYGNGMLVTNSHCLPYDKDGVLSPAVWNQTFYAGFKNGYYLMASTPKSVYYNKDHDYAVIKLWVNIDRRVGRMGVDWKPISFFKRNRPLQMISYSGDHCISFTNCVAKLSTGNSRGILFGDNLTHDLDAKRGSSGSALFSMRKGQAVMQALNWGEYRDGLEYSLTLGYYTGFNPNLAKPAGVWKPAYQKLKKIG